MKIKKTNRLRVEDLNPTGKEIPDWLPRLLTPINEIIDTVGNALINNLTFDENIRSQIHQFTVNTAQFPYALMNTTKQVPKGVLIMQCYVNGNPSTVITNALSVDWWYDETINIRNIAGLTPGVEYVVRLLVV